MKSVHVHYQRGIPFQLADIRGERAAEIARLIATLHADAADGNGEAQHLLGLAYFRGEGVERDPEQARQLQLAAAQAGVVDAQFEVSLLLAQGLGGNRDTRAASRWEKRAADAGHPRACFNRGARVASAKKPDFSAAADWYERAATAGHAEAAARLCKMHVLGQGVKRSETIAERWYQRAAELGWDWSSEAQA
jgi:TPR repeat protein